MRILRHVLVWLSVAAFSMAVSGHAIAEFVEPPLLAKRAASGELPPVAERLPDEPLIVKLDGDGRSPGKHGGEMRLLMGKQKDIRMIYVYGYARLVGYNPKLELAPDILAALDVEDNRIFTLRLRKGHKWSDGHPFTTEDFRYYWEDVANNEELSPYGPPRQLMVDDEPPQVEIIDETTIRYSWSKPNPFFVPALAGARPLSIYRPAHYLKQFHASYVDADELRRMVEEVQTRNWAGLHTRFGHQYKFNNPDLPVLQPWMNTTKPPSERYLFKRNPFYHRVDAAGLQLPYIDQVAVNIADNKLIPAKTGAGESDLQARNLRFDNYTFLKAGEQRNDYEVRLWRTVNGSRFTLYPNLNVTDPVWQKVVRDVRFRRALSLAINRHEINQVVYYGLANEGNNTVLKESPLYEPDFQQAWADFDLEQTAALLDEMGLDQRDERGIRLLADGRPLEIIVETTGESTEETDVLELVHDSWLRAGVKLHSRPSQREVFRNRIFAGETVMAVWFGLENAIPTAQMSPAALAPTQQQQFQWPKWGQFYETGEQVGDRCDMPVVERLAALNEQWRSAADKALQKEIWQEMLKIHSDYVLTIGTINSVRQPVVVNNRLRNVPKEGIYSWSPGAYFGIYQPDTFWMDES